MGANTVICPKCHNIRLNVPGKPGWYYLGTCSLCNGIGIVTVVTAITYRLEGSNGNVSKV